MIDYFSEQLNIINRDEKLVCFMYRYKSGHMETRMTTHPYYYDLQGLRFVYMNGITPVFEDNDE